LVAELTAQLGDQASADFGELVVAGLDADVLFAHLKQVESGLSQTPDSPQWTGWLIKAPKIGKDLEKLAGMVEQLDQQGLFNPKAFVRVCNSVGAGSLPFLTQVAATAQMPHLPQAMRARAQLLDQQVETIGRWRRGWLPTSVLNAGRGNDGNCSPICSMRSRSRKVPACRSHPTIFV
jgi:hypothetical protein